jgi:hypothetical protein
MQNQVRFEYHGRVELSVSRADHFPNERDLRFSAKFQMVHYSWQVQLHASRQPPLLVHNALLANPRKI